MSTPDLDAVRQRWKNATPGLFRGDASRRSHFEGPYAIIKPGTASENVVWCKFNTHFDHGADAELFVNAEADIGALLAEVDRLRDVLARIAGHTDPEPARENYRADDREGCLDTVFALARAAGR